MARVDLRNTQTVERERKEVLKIAKQLCYSDEIVEKLKKAKTVNELDRIMKDARGSK